MRILFVEDDPRDADLTIRALAHQAPDTRVDLARSLAEARARLASDPAYDLVLSDVGLPDGTGPELASEIRERALPLAIVLLTADGEVDTVVAALKAGADDYLTKSARYTPNLAAALEAALARFRSGAARRPPILHVLHVEPSRWPAESMQRHLEKHSPNLRLEVIAGTEELMRRLRGPAATPIDVLLLEARREGEASLEALKSLLDEGRLGMPVVMMGDESDQQLAAYALRLGADVHYVVRHPHYLYTLPATIENAHRSALLAREERALRESQARLAASEEQYRQLFDSNPHPMCVIHPGTLRFLAVNDAYVRQFGWSREEFAALGLADLRPPEELPALYEVIDLLRHRPEELVHPRTLRYWRKDGTTFRAEVTSAELVFQGQPARVALVTDVTERERGVELLRQSEEQFRQLAETIQQVFWTWDPAANRVLYVSPAYERIWGRPREALYADPQSWFAAIHPEDRRLAEEAFRQLASADYRIVHGDGTIRWIHDRAFPVRDGTGQVCRVVGVAEDVTDRVKAEQELRFQNAVLSTQLEASIDGILVVDEHGRIASFNSRFVEMWGVPLAIVEQGRDDLLLEQVTRRLADPQAFLERVRHLYANRQEAGQDELQLADGRVFERYSAPMLGTDGHYFGRVWYFRDVTDKRKAAEERDHLQSQLLQSQKMEAIGRLAGGVAHDFNNMLGVILGYADLALRRLSPVDPLARTLVGIRGAAERSADLTRRLLAFSRRQTIAPRVLDLDTQLRGMESLLRRIIGEDVDLEFALGGDTWPVLMDPSQLDQILANLAVNARDAMPGGGTLSVSTANVVLDEDYCRTHAEARPGDHVCLSVSDSGCGMDPQTLERAFEPFFTTKPEGMGTGLGLAMIYGIVRQNGGSARIESELGRGTTFRILLPRQPHAAPAAAAPPAQPRRGHETILLVEDEPSLRNLTHELLADLGYDVLAAAGPGEAIALCEKHADAIDLLLTDVVMPIMSGKELAGRLAALRPGMKVLFTSGYTADAIARQGVLDAGVQFLEKPFTIERLAQKVAEALGADDAGARVSAVGRRLN